MNISNAEGISKIESRVVIVKVVHLFAFLEDCRGQMKRITVISNRKITNKRMQKIPYRTTVPDALIHSIPSLVKTPGVIQACRSVQGSARGFEGGPARPQPNVR